MYITHFKSSIKLITFLTFFGSIVQAEMLTSDSKYPIIISVYDSKKICDVNQGKLDTAFKGIAKSVEKSDGFFEKFKTGVSQLVNTAAAGNGCDKVGESHTLAAGGENLPIGSTVIAFKDPFAAWKLPEKKIVNPLPTVCKMDGDMILRTRKSGTLKSMFGFGGDGGLECVPKNPAKKK